MIIKCKMCGGDLRIEEGTTVAECEYCGTKQTVPNADNEKKIKLFERANRLRAACEFDKAAGVYESIVADFDTEAEAYWGLILCKFGIEYVDDPATGDKVPTCHRSSFDSVLEDPNFELVMENSDAISRKVYRDEAKAIEELRRSIIEVSSKEEPYDVFISYKELDASGERTIDSVIAQDIYKELTNEGYRVFFSRISLESKLGVEYEPYIFAALNSARVMIVVGTDYDNFNAVWVKNEWSRYLALIASGQKKTLIPCFKNIDAYDMPREFNKLAAQDMGKVGAMQDLLRGVEKLLSKNEGSAAVHSDSKSATEPLLTRAFMFLEDGNWKEADKYCEKVLDQEPENAQAYLGKLMAELHVKKKESLNDRNNSFKLSVSSNYQKAVNFAAPELKAELESLARGIGDCEKGDTVIFGSYIHGKNKSSGKEGIEWLVLERIDSEILLISKYALDCVPYDTSYTWGMAKNITWEICGIRKWLNKTFLKEAFNNKEQALIQTTTVLAENNPKYGTKAGKDTNDKIFLLSIGEANEYFADDEARKCVPTEYALARGVSVNDDCNADGEHTCWYWLRSPGSNQGDAASVYSDGSIVYHGEDGVNVDYFGVRPVLWINLDPNGSAKGSENIRLNKTYDRAVDTMKRADTEEDYRAAAEEFKKISGVKDADKLAAQCLEKANERVYECSIECIKENSPQGYEKAISKLKSISGYKDSDEQLTALLKKLEELRKNFEDVRSKFNDPDCTVGISFEHSSRIFAICSDDTMLAAGIYLRSDLVSCVPRDVIADSKIGGEFKLRKVRDVYSRYVGLVVVHMDGTAKEYFKTYRPIDVSHWKNVISITNGSIGKGYEIIGLRADGTLAFCGGSKIYSSELSQWTNIVSVYSSYSDFFGICKDGTVKYFGESSKDWRYITAAKNIVRLQGVLSRDKVAVFYSDGSAEVVKRGSTSPEMKWEDIVELDTFGNGELVVLQGNGKVLVYMPAKFESYEKPGNREAAWTDIVSICAGSRHVVGLKRDGTVVAEAYDTYGRYIDIGRGDAYDEGQCDVSDWQNIVAVYAEMNFTIGVRADGSVVHCGSHDIITHGWSDLDWKLFDGIEDLEENIKRNKEFKASMERAAEEQREARKRAEEERKRAAEEARLARIAELEKEKQALQAEIPTIKGLFAAGKIKKLQARVDEIEIKLTKLK